MNTELALNPNRLVASLGKPSKDFTKADIVKYITENGIRMVNFMYPAGDGRLKTLNFVINNAAYLDAILTCGERVDGSSLFPFIEAGSSDLYVLPRFSTAFLDPFAEIPTLSMLCSYFNKDGLPLESSPENTLKKACKAFNEVTGMEFQAMGELEYYVIAPDTGMFPATDQKGYHESAPYAKFNEFRTQCMAYIAQAGGQIKYGHSEVGNFTIDGKIYEQNEIEFLPVNAADAADQLMIAKWIIRNLAHYVCAKDHGRKGWVRTSHPHAHSQGWQEHDARRRSAFKSSQNSHCRNDGTRPFNHSFREHQSDFILPSRTSSGSSYKHLLGRPKPFRTGPRTSRMGCKERYVPDSQSARTAQQLRHHPETDGRDALS